MSPTRRERVLGFFMGVMLGDALGAPIEMMTAQRIKKIYGDIRTLVSFEHNKHLRGSPIGTTTDDTQLTLAVAEALIDAGQVDIEVIAYHHVLAYTATTLGWGRSTRDSLERMIAGVEPIKAGITTKAGCSCGNGVAMKAGPLGIHAALTNSDIREHMEEFTLLTHHTNMAVASGAVWASAIEYLLLTESYDPMVFASVIYEAAKWGSSKGVVKADHDLHSRISEAFRFRHYKTSESIVSAFGGGSPYVYDSLPFAVLFFMQDPFSYETGIRTLRAGGDTDTTTSMVMSALGALNGNQIFPHSIIAQIPGHQHVIDVAVRFCNRFGVT